MENKELFRQMIAMNKTAFDNSFNAMTMVYEQNEKMVQTFLSQASWMPDTGKTAIQEWLKAYRKGFSEYKKLVDESYANVESFFNESKE